MRPHWNTLGDKRTNDGLVGGGKAETWWGRRPGKKDLPDTVQAHGMRRCPRLHEAPAHHSKAAVGRVGRVFAASLPRPHIIVADHSFTTTVGRCRPPLALPGTTLHNTYTVHTTLYTQCWYTSTYYTVRRYTTGVVQ
jgi:hypothetical protein